MEVKFLLISFLIVSLGQSQSTNDSYECRIYSDIYKQYLYGKYKFLGLGSRRLVYLWQENKYNFFIYQPKTHFTDDDPSGVWYFEPVLDKPNTFYIRNKKYKDEYLRGSDSFQELIFKKNRAVFVENINDRFDDESFMWKLSPVPNTHLLYIWNVKFQSPMYSREHHRVKSGNTNSGWVIVASLWDGEPNSEQFEWLLRCRNSIKPVLTAS